MFGERPKPAVSGAVFAFRVDSRDGDAVAVKVACVSRGDGHTIADGLRRRGAMDIPYVGLLPPVYAHVRDEEKL